MLCWRQEEITNTLEVEDCGNSYSGFVFPWSHSVKMSPISPTGYVQACGLGGIAGTMVLREI